MALPNMEMTVPTVIIVKSRVHKDASGLLLSSISYNSLIQKIRPHIRTDLNIALDIQLFFLIYLTVAGLFDHFH
jgi:hypothetical protein